MGLGNTRRLVGTVAGLLAFAAAVPAYAGTLDPSQSFMVIQIGNLAPLVIPAANNNGTLDPGTKTINLAAGVFTTFGPGPIVTFPPTAPTVSLIVTAANGVATYTTGFSVTNPIGTGTLAGGGIGRMTGQAIAIINGTAGIAINLSIVGTGGTTTATALGSPVTVTGAVWGTNSVQITGIASNVLTITNGTRSGLTGIAFTLEPTANENTVTATLMFKMQTFAATRTSVFVTGSRNTMSSGVGTVTLISPMRIITGLGFLLPGVATQILTFVPEPGTVLLLGSSAVALAIAGRNRRRN